MSDTPWFESYFGEDYLEIHRDDLPPDLGRAQVDDIVALLSLSPRARILDLACGHGRHAIPLARLGFQVCGYDLSQAFLDRARADAGEQGASVRWVQGDMRELPFEQEFDAAINVFTAFGYFADPEDDLRVLQEVRRTLAPGGRFLLETIHRDALMARFRNRSWDRTSTGTLVLRERRLDLPTDVMHEDVLVIRPDGSRSKHQFAVRMRSLHSYLSLLSESGLEPLSWYGGLDGRPLELDSWRLVLVSGRPG
jgi:SAM-dependent methyltransferase